MAESDLVPNEYPITAAVRCLRDGGIGFEPHIFDYVEKGGTRHSAKMLGVSEHAVVKTLVFETDEKKPLMILMHGDLQVSAKNLARHLGVKSVAPVSPEKANKLTGYLVGRTSPFGIKTGMPVYAEKSIFDLDKIYINGGKRGFLIGIGPEVLPEILKLEVVVVGVS